MIFNLIPEHYGVTDAQYLERINTCVSCEHYIQAISACKRCGCVMPLKAKLRFAKCPERKWQVILPVKPELDQG